MSPKAEAFAEEAIRAVGRHDVADARIAVAQVEASQVRKEPADPTLVGERSEEVEAREVERVDLVVLAEPLGGGHVFGTAAGA